jgi:hypothetical protein
LYSDYRTVGMRHGQFDAKTDARGCFRIDADEAQRLRVLVRAQGFANAVSDERAFDPSAGWSDLAIELGQGGAIEGTVFDAAGRPMPRAMVAINDFHTGARTLFADAEGRYRCERLLPGGCEVRLARGWFDERAGISTQTGMPLEPVLPDCEVRQNETTTFDLVVARCRLAGRLDATGFDPRDWRVELQLAGSLDANHRKAVLGPDGRFVLTSSSAGAHTLDLHAPGGPFGSVWVRVPIELREGDNTLAVPLAMAPFQARAAGAAGTQPGDRAWLMQEALGRSIWSYVQIDPLMLEFGTPLAPVGEASLWVSPAGGKAREVGRFTVAPR